MTDKANTAGLADIISDAEITRIHGNANFGPTMTPREVVNDGVRKYAVGYSSGHTQLRILLEHGLITKPRPGRYDASLTKKGKRYARALGMYQGVTAASAEARIAELERERDDADRRAGAAERQLEDKVDSIVKRRQWLSRAKAERGYHDNTSFDRVWADTCAAADRAQAAEARADRLARAVRSAQSFIADGGLANMYPGSAIYAELTQALQQEG